jgi:hypothetical protein
MSTLNKPTRADYEKLKQLEAANDNNAVINFMNQFDWSSEVIEEDGQYGLKNCFGELLTPIAFEDFQLLTHEVLTKTSRVVAQKDGKWGVLITDGSENWLVQPEYEEIGFPNVLTTVKKDGKMGVLNIATGEFLIPCENDHIYTAMGMLFNNGIAIYEKDGLSGIINEEGEYTEPIFDEVDLEGNGNIRVRQNDIWGYANEEGKLTLDPDESWFYEVI